MSYNPEIFDKRMEFYRLFVNKSSCFNTFIS